jgi:hypothetical protein
MKDQIKFKRREKGQSLVELAVSFMLVMLILSGAVDFGRAYFALVALRDAAQEGVIYASVHPDDQAGAIQRVYETSDSPIDLTTTTVTFEYPAGFASDGSDACAGFVDTGVDTDGVGPTDIESNYVTVVVAYDFAFTMPLIPPIIGTNAITLRAEQTHTILSPSC